MPDGDAAERIADLLSAPLEELLVALGSGIGRSQAEMDRHSIEIQRLIDEDPVLSQYGLEATWYQIPTTELELKVAVAMEQEEQEGPTPAAPIPGQLLRAAPKLWLQPVNARYTNQFSYDVQAASTVKLSVVAVPPPGSATATRPVLTSEQALGAAGPHLFKEADGTPSPRVTINFNPGARAWYVVQTSETDDVVELRALVKVDDETGEVLKHTGGPE
jgi:hypothetical protein